MCDFFTERWHILPEKVGVVYLGMEEPLDLSVLTVPARLHSFSEEAFLFTAGSIRPARGLEDIIQALAILSAQGCKRKLVIAGGIEPSMRFYKQRLDRMAAILDVSQQVLWADYLTPNEMAWCFLNCALFVMTSRVEACPNTALESMGYGCLCVTSDSSPMPEFFQDSALYYRAGDADDLARQVAVALEMGEKEKALLREDAKVRAGCFRWQHTAKETISQFELAIRQRDV